jgi:beta-aspartyl-peptidase (threonine type)
MTIALMVHGGASTIEPEEERAYAEGVRAALDAGWAVLEGGGSAVEAVEAAIRVMESDETFNAGRGGALNADGAVECCAALMRGDDLHFGSVSIVQGLPHPISVARLLLDQPRMLAAEGAERFAEEWGAERCPPEALITPRQREKWQEQRRKQAEGGEHDTVGCVALDSEGRLAAGTSTGGDVNTPAGRVGDSPLVGCGLYADDGVGACSATGVGETIIPVALSREAIQHIAEGESPQAAAERVITMLHERVNGEGGCIVLDRAGRIGWAHNSSHMSCAYRTEGMKEPVVKLKRRP